MCESERAYNNTQRNYLKKIKIIKKKKNGRNRDANSETLDL